MARILVTGAGGFIGHHLVKKLKAAGHFVRGIDIKYPEYEKTAADEFWIKDLRWDYNAFASFNGEPFCNREFDEVYSLAADMGGIGYITSHLADIARNNILINVNMLEAARLFGVSKYLYTSSACVYAQSKQHDANVIPLKEEDAYPADPEPGYGWEKLFAEEMCKYYRKDFGMDTKIVRFHNVYGPLGTYDGGREKSPAALSRKIAKTADGGVLEIWGDGKQTRSYMYIDDCVKGLMHLMASDYHEPLNLGTDELLTIDQQAEITCKVAGKTLTFQHDLTKPQGVRGRNSDNTRLREVLGWEPKTTFAEGMAKTYPWIAEQVTSITMDTNPS
jgi:nucleoside-diphosphate-sugar epimerase